jgi:hypothetical protein
VIYFRRGPSFRAFCRQIALRFDETVFFYDPFVFFEGTFNPVHVIAVSIGHRGNNPVIAMSLGAKGHVRDPSHHFTNAELAHRLLPPFNDLWYPTFSSLLQPPWRLRRKEETNETISRPSKPRPPNAVLLALRGRERAWRHLYINGATPEDAVERAQVHYNNTRPPFEPAAQVMSAVENEADD